MTPSHQYPTGVVMSARRRMKVIEWAQRRNVIIIEDDYDSEFRYEGQPVASIHSMDYPQADDLYWHIFKITLSGPSNRLHRGTTQSVRIHRGLEVERGQALQFLCQPVLAEFINQGYYARHIKRMRNSYAEKRLCLKQSLNRHLHKQHTQSSAPAGLHVLIWLHNTHYRDMDNLLDDALEQNLGIYPANYLYEKPPGRNRASDGIHIADI